MTRSWTDPRTGKRWQIDVVSASRSRGNPPGRGSGEEVPSALLFENGGTSYAVPSDEATRLEALHDDRLAELLDRAREGQDPQQDLPDAEGEERAPRAGRVRGRGKASPSATGRESSPHRDPATE